MYGAKLFEELNEIAKREILKEGYKNTIIGRFENHLYSADEFDDGTICIYGAFPYDNAPHFWAHRIEGDNGFTIYFMGRKYKEFPSMNYEEVAAELARYDKLVKPKMIHDSAEESNSLHEGYDARSIQKFINSYGFDGYDVYENTPTELAIDFDGESKEDIIPLVNRLKSIIPDVDVEDHYIRISLNDKEVKESFKSADNFTTEPRHIKRAFGKWAIPDEDEDGDIDRDDFIAFMRNNYSTAGLDSSNWTPDMWETARTFYDEALKESLNESELIEKFNAKQAIKAIKDNAAKAKDFVNNNPKLNKLLDKAEAMLHSSSNIKNADKIAYMISMIRDWINGSYKDIPVNVIVGLTAALLYWILPDLIPGPVDDAGVLAIALKAFGKDIDNYIAWKNNQGKTKTESLGATGPVKAPDEFDEYYESISEEDLEDLTGFPADEYPCESVPGYDCKHICWLYARPMYEDALANDGLEIAELVSEDGGTPFVAQVVHDRIIPVPLDEIESCVY